MSYMRQTQPFVLLIAMQIYVNTPAPSASDHTTLNADTVAMLLDQALNQKWFNVCPIATVHQMFNVKLVRDAYLQAMHCVSWADMTQTQQDYCIRKTIDIIRDVSGHRIIVE
jgi:hypothetical protein